MQESGYISFTNASCGTELKQKQKMPSPSGIRQISLFNRRDLTPMQVHAGRDVAVLIKLNWNAEIEYVNIMARQQGFNTIFQFLNPFYPSAGFIGVF